MSTCAHCGAELQPGARFCASCGNAVAHECPTCGSEVGADDRFCSSCGTALGEQEPEAPSSTETRKVISVLFADLVGFTAHAEQADPEDVRGRLTAYHRRIREDVERHGGRIEKLLGDGVLAVFGAPIAHEDDPERAVRAALRSQVSVEELNAEQPELALAARVAVTTGEAVVQLDDSNPDREGIVGDVVNTASRLQDVAEPGTVVVGQRTYSAARGAIEFTSLDPVTVKGKAEPIPIWRADSARSRFGVAVEEHDPTDFIGRERELSLLVDAFERTVAERSSQLVTISGEPGVGKSRLVHEFRKSLDDRPDLTWWRQGRCLPYGEGITFFALGEIIKAQAGILEAENPLDARRKLQESVAALLEEEGDVEWVARTLEPLAGVGGSQAEVEFGELATGWRRFLAALATRNPLVIVIEDLHWAEEPLIGFLDDLVAWAIDLPILVVSTTRPELYAEHPEWGGGKRNAVTVALSPLGNEDIAALLASILPDPLMTAERQQDLLERCGGNPLYAIEFARLVSESGGDLVPPENVQALIAARLDLLDDGARGLLQAASVVGRVFWANALKFMTPELNDQSESALRELVTRELIRPVRVASMVGQDEYAFWHILVRDVAYGQIPRADRARLHEQVARWIEAVSADNLAESAALLSHHYERALELSQASGDQRDDLRSQAHRFTLLAAEQTRHLDATGAAAFYVRAADLAASKADRGRALLRAIDLEADSGAIDQAELHAQEAIDLFAETGLDSLQAHALTIQGRLAWLRGDGPASEQHRRDALALINEEEISEAAAHVLGGSASHAFMRNNAAEAIEYAQRALRISRELGSVDLEMFNMRTLGSSLCITGQHDEGIALLRRSMDLALDRGYTRALNYIANNLHAFVNITDGAQAGLDVINVSIDLADKRGYEASSIFSRVTRIESMFPMGLWDECVKELKPIIEWDDEHGGSQIGLMARGWRTTIEHLRGNRDTAMREVDWAVETARAAADTQVLLPALVQAIPVYFDVGRFDEAGAIADEFEDAGKSAPDFLAGVLIIAAEPLVALGRLEQLERLVAMCGPFMPLQQHNASAAAAVLDQANGHDGEAVAKLQEAIAGTESLQFLVQANWFRIIEARSRLALGDRDRATMLLDEARSFFEPIGAVRFTNDIDQLQRAESA